MEGAEMQQLSSLHDEGVTSLSYCYTKWFGPKQTLTTYTVLAFYFVHTAQCEAGEWILDGLTRSTDDKLEQFQEFEYDIIKVAMIKWSQGSMTNLLSGVKSTVFASGNIKSLGISLQTIWKKSDWRP
jgi:hypothetical protein